jgi:hypothetical protein
MKKINTVLLISLLATISCTNTGKVKTVDFTSQWDTVRALENPDKGWYHHLLDNGINKYAIRNDSAFSSFPGLDHLYLRLAWSYLEPEEGKFDWHRIDSIIAKYVPLGYGISFRITCKETGRYPGSVNQEVGGVQYATPYWVRKAGAKGVDAVRGETKSWTPDWDDPVYLSKLDNFYRAFAEKYDGKSYVRYIDVGSIGEWGEGHTSFSTRIPPTVEEVKANINIFLKNISKTQIVVTDDLLYYGKSDEDQKELLNYCLENGISLRDDSPLVSWYLKNNLETWSVSHPSFYDPAYLKNPVIFELEHYSTVKRDSNWLGKNGTETINKYGYSSGHIMRKAIETEHSTYIGYHGYCEEWLSDNPDLTIQLLNICGYWYFPVSLEYATLMHPGTNAIKMEWYNRGVAPAYNNYQLVLKFEKTDNRVFYAEIDDSGNRNWLPGKSIPNEYNFVIPDNVPEGKYRIGFKLMKNQSGAIIPIDLGLDTDLFDNEGFVMSGPVRISR